MKKIFTIGLLSLIAQASFAQSFSPGEGQGNLKCDIDSFKTNSLNVSTGIGISSTSDSVLMSSGYGYNSHYTAPNDNKDTLWTVSHLASNYKLRLSSPFPYTGVYMVPGDHPSIMKVDGTVLDGYYGIFSTGGTCVQSHTTAPEISNWISVYADAGGQNGSITNAIGDGYAYERCFYICKEDSITFNLKLLADDVIDTVQVDNVSIFINPSPTVAANYDCSKTILLNKKLALASGRHILRVWTRDNAGGHLGLNVYGHIQSSGGVKNIIRSKFDSRCNFNPLGIVKASRNAINISISPNPSNGHFTISLPNQNEEYNFELMDMSSKVLMRKKLKSGSTDLDLEASSGIYFIRISSKDQVSTQKVLIEN